MGSALAIPLMRNESNKHVCEKKLQAAFVELIKYIIRTRYWLDFWPTIAPNTVSAHRLLSYGDTWSGRKKKPNSRQSQNWTTKQKEMCVGEWDWLRFAEQINCWSEKETECKRSFLCRHSTQSESWPKRTPAALQPATE